jgi:ketosteroid isomerase-like protein
VTDEPALVLEVEAAYRHCVEMFDRRDATAFASCFDDPCAGLSGDHGLMIVRNDAVQEHRCQQVMASADDQGWTRTEIDQLQIWPWSPTLAQLVSDVTHYNADGAVLQRVRASYLFRRQDRRWKVMTYGVLEEPFSGPGRPPPSQ